MTPQWFFGEVIVGDRGSDVEVIQRKLGMHISGEYDQSTAVTIRGFQWKHGLPVTGIVDHKTADALGEAATSGLVPDWYDAPLKRGSVGPDVLRLCQLLRMEEPSRVVFSREVEDAVRRWQSARGIYPNGIVTEEMAVVLGD